MAVVPAACFQAGYWSNRSVTADAPDRTTGSDNGVQRMIDLTGPCFGGYIDATKGIQDCFAATNHRRIIDGREVCRPSFERRVHGADGDNGARSLDATRWPCIPREANSIEILLKAGIHGLNGGGMGCHDAGL